MFYKALTQTVFPVELKDDKCIHRRQAIERDGESEKRARNDCCKASFAARKTANTSTQVPRIWSAARSAWLHRRVRKTQQGGLGSTEGPAWQADSRISMLARVGPTRKIECCSPISGKNIANPLVEADRRIGRPRLNGCGWSIFWTLRSQSKTGRCRGSWWNGPPVRQAEKLRGQ